jgi:hypothetical protein
MKFMQAFIQDNPFRENGYLERLERTSDKAKRERLFHGNWEYDDDPNALCNFDDIDAVFENDHLIAKIQSEEYYLTCDVARLGSDKARIAVWKGFKDIHKSCWRLRASGGIGHRVRITDPGKALKSYTKSCWRLSASGGIGHRIRITDPGKALKSYTKSCLRLRSSGGIGHRIRITDPGKALKSYTKSCWRLSASGGIGHRVRITDPGKALKS